MGNQARQTSARIILFRWMLVMPAVAAAVGALLLCLSCWLGDGTLASWYRVEYFMPLPLYMIVAACWTFVLMMPIGGILGFVLIRKCRKNGRDTEPRSAGDGRTRA